MSFHLLMSEGFTRLQTGSSCILRNVKVLSKSVIPSRITLQFLPGRGHGHSTGVRWFSPTILSQGNGYQEMANRFKCLQTAHTVGLQGSSTGHPRGLYITIKLGFYQCFLNRPKGAIDFI